ncbi:MAG: hypothetical protein AAGA09_09725 [Pseudomonadota bacterium]
MSRDEHDAREELAALLDGAAPTAAPDGFKRALLEGFDVETRARKSLRFNLLAIFSSASFAGPAGAGAAACVAALGLFAGVLTAGGERSLAPEEEYYQYAESAFELAFYETEEEAIWDAE